jgi:hypothetical protein
MRVPEAQKAKKRLHDRARERLLQFVGRIIVAVDVAPNAGAAQEIRVIVACEQPDVVDLRDSWKAALNRARDQVLGIVTAERVVEVSSDAVPVEHRTCSGPVNP